AHPLGEAVFARAELALRAEHAHPGGEDEAALDDAGIGESVGDLLEVGALRHHELLGLGERALLDEEVPAIAGAADRDEPENDDEGEEPLDAADDGVGAFPALRLALALGRSVAAGHGGASYGGGAK